jgi:hypothetical protein
MSGLLACNINMTDTSKSLSTTDTYTPCQRLLWALFLPGSSVVCQTPSVASLAANSGDKTLPLQGREGEKSLPIALYSLSGSLYKVILRVRKPKWGYSRISRPLTPSARGRISAQRLNGRLRTQIRRKGVHTLLLPLHYVATI